MRENGASESHYKAAIEADEKRQHAAALQRYKAAIDLCPTEPRYWIAFGACLIALRHWNRAINALTRGIELRTHYAEADARMMQAEAVFGAGRAREARKQWEIVSSMQPTYPSHDAPIQEARQRLRDVISRR